MKQKFQITIYPYLAGISFVLILFADNLGDVEFSEIVRSLLAVFILTALSIMVCWLWLRNWKKASLLSAVITIFVLTYGHIYDGLKETEVLVPFARHRFLLALIAMLLLGFSWFIWKRVKSTEALDVFFAGFCIILFVSPLFKIGTFYLFTNNQMPNGVSAIQNATADLQNGTEADIYYIILDEYGRADTLQEFYGIDNSEFINQLTQMGFYVAPQATSNYPQTLLSLSSSLNFQYIDDSMISADTLSSDRRELIDKVAHSRVRQILQDVGYKFVAFDTGYVTSIEDADIYYKYLRSQDQGQTYILSMNPFEGMVFEKSIARPLLDFGFIPQNIKNEVLKAPYMNHAGRILSVFEKTAKIPDMEGKYFVFAHIVAPHPPFVFGPNGELLDHSTTYKLGEITKLDGSREDYTRGYNDELRYINTLTLRMVKKILAESDTPPIIIIQGDHGPSAYLDWESKENSNMKDRFSILNAYYLGNEGSGLIYPSISPVNTFRVVLNEFFGMGFELLPDRNFFSLWQTPYQFDDVTNEVNGE